MVWNRKAQEWKPIGDLSEYYDITFPDSSNLDVIVDSLRLVMGVRGAWKVPIPISDSCNLGGDTLAPWDHYLLEQRPYLQYRDPVTGAGGAGISCAWGLLPELPNYDVRVALIDGRVDTAHLDLSASWRITRPTSSPLPDGHSTKGAGIIGAEAWSAEGIAGIGLYVDGIGYDRSGGRNRLAYSWARQDSVDLIVAPYHIWTDNPDLLDSTLLWQEVRACHQAGIIIVASAGSVETPPFHLNPLPAAFDDWVIAVAAHRTNGNRDPYSNYPCDTCSWEVDVAGPGDSVWTTTVGGYAYHTNTSSAAAVVGGIIALGLSVDEKLDFRFAREYLSSSAVAGGDYAPLTMGAGNVNAEAFIHHMLNCCQSNRGDVNGDGNDADQIDLTYLVDMLFSTGPLPPCQYEGNVNGDSNESIDPVDLSYLVDYLYWSGSPPPSCP